MDLMNRTLPPIMFQVYPILNPPNLCDIVLYKLQCDIINSESAKLVSSHEQHDEAIQVYHNIGNILSCLVQASSS